MSASQAHLLSLTARLHDVEAEAQSILQAKLRLTDAEDEAYQAYLAALDATQITGNVLNGAEKTKVFATFQNLSGGYQNMILAGEGQLAYGLVNEDSGQLYVDEAMYQAYKNYKGDDSDEFALSRLGYSADEIAAFTEYRKTKGTFYPLENATDTSNSVKLKLVNPNDTYDTKSRYYTRSDDGNGYKEIKDVAKYVNNGAFTTDAINLYVEMAPEDTTEPNAQIVDYYNMLNKLGTSEGQYYKNTYEMIKNQGGCEILDKECQNNSEWLTSMVSFGKVGIYTLSEDKGSESGYKMERTSTSSSSTLSDTSVTSMDSTELKRAEAEYNKTLKDLDKKDTQFDLTLEDLELERNTITTEMDQVKTVIKENVDRTYGVFG